MNFCGFTEISQFATGFFWISNDKKPPEAKKIESWMTPSLGLVHVWAAKALFPNFVV